MMNWMRVSMCVLVLSGLGIVGCEKTTDDGEAGDAAAAVSGTDTMIVASTILCGKCGEQKGTDTCCVSTADVCACGMHKGSALCCVTLPANAVGEDICATCGHVAAAGHACDEDCEKCAECGLHKGSPACCKLNI